MNYITQIWTGKTNAETHNALVRYGKGDFKKEEVIITVSSKSVKIQGGLDMVNPIQRFVCSCCKEDVKINGAIPTTKDVASDLRGLGIDYSEKRRFGKSGAIYIIDTTLPPPKALDFVNKLYEYYLLLNVISGNNKIKVKKQDTPKIGSLAPKFITAEVSRDNLGKVKEEFLFDAKVDKLKKAVIKHTVVIEDILFDDKLLKSDPERARLEAKRKGALRRVIDMDGNVLEKEYRFEI